MNPRRFPPPSEPPKLRAVPRRRLADRPRAPETGLPPIERLPRGGPLPASPYQQWIWEAPGGKPTADLNMPFTLRFSGPPALPALFAAFRELERRQDGLRTRLVAAAGRPGTACQLVDPPGGLEVPLIDLSGLGPKPKERELGRLATEDALQPLDMAKRMFRVRLVRLAAADHLAFLNLHHLIGDGWSTELLRGELAVLYAAFAAGRPSPLAELPVQFADFAGWQRRIEEGEVVARQLEYWRGRLERLPPPFTLPGEPAVPGRGTVQGFCWFSAPVTARIRALARAERATPAMVILAAFGLLLTAYSGETDLVIESKVLGRPRPELAGIIGFFMGTLPHRIDLSGDPGFADALLRTRDVVVEDYCNQDLSFPKLMRELLPGRRNLSPLGFNMISSPTPVSLAARAREEAVFVSEGRRPDQEIVRYDLVLQGREDPDFLRLILMGAAARFEPESMAEVAADLETLLIRALDDPAAPVARLLPAPRYRFARRPSGG